MIKEPVEEGGKQNSFLIDNRKYNLLLEAASSKRSLLLGAHFNKNFKSEDPFRTGRWILLLDGLIPLSSGVQTKIIQLSKRML